LRQTQVFIGSNQEHEAGATATTLRPPQISGDQTENAMAAP
jgi:hypothetical protein